MQRFAVGAYVSPIGVEQRGTLSAGFFRRSQPDDPALIAAAE
ncbi:hypothetical protein P8H27_14070 [Pseudomonas sp. sp1636]|nr:hypothetical protein [Pseudomonas sp. sp1636]MDM8350012.1 hypothetical protein [Pseudomonas sp. sp1636]